MSEPVYRLRFCCASGFLPDWELVELIWQTTIRALAALKRWTWLPDFAYAESESDISDDADHDLFMVISETRVMLEHRQRQGNLPFHGRIGQNGATACSAHYRNIDISYLERFIQQMKDSGEWDQLTSERKAFIEELDDDVVRSIMAHSDEKELEELDSYHRLTSENTEQRDAEVHRILDNAILNLSEVLDGQLVSPEWWSAPGGDNVPLTPLGQALGEFFVLAQGHGISAPDAWTGLNQLSVDAAIVLKRLASSQSD